MSGTTIAAISTPPGSGGIAVIRISGPRAFDVASKIFVSKNKNKTIKNTPGHTAIYGQIREKDETIDDGLALVFRAPASFTGEDTVELNCHGGDAIAQAVLRVCFSAGAEPAQAGEFSKRAFLNGKMDLLQAEGIIDLIASGDVQKESQFNYSKNQHKITEIKSIKNTLQSILAHLVAWIDYPEEEVPDIEEKEFLKQIKEIENKCQIMLENYEQGQKIRRGLKVAIVGEPNVGKSSLFNLLVEEQRAIVTSIAGTTRDVLREQIYIHGYPLYLSDTAGIRESADIIEREGIVRSKDEILGSDLIITVMETGQNPMTIKHAIPKADQKPWLCVVNKDDLGMQTDIETLQQEFDRVVVVSIQERPGEAKAKMEQAMAELLAIGRLDPDAVLLSNERQRTAIQKVYEGMHEILQESKTGIIYDVTSIKIENALKAFAELLGENVDKEVLDEVFSRFCVGK